MFSLKKGVDIIVDLFYTLPFMISITFNFLQVEYILVFGAADVIVLTIIIVLIPYLILQCRGQQGKCRAARRRVTGLSGDTSSCGGAGDSYLELSTVDFIVPGRHK